MTELSVWRSDIASCVLVDIGIGENVLKKVPRFLAGTWER